MTRATCGSCGTAGRGKFCSECGARLDGGCRNCGTPLAPTAQFCPACGTAAARPQGSTPARMGNRRLPPASAIALAAVGVGIAAVIFMSMRDEPLPVSNPSATAAAAGQTGAPDISAMSPRERAARLYDRVMQYAEQGKQDSVAFFSPMALAAHEALPDLALDLDARYDYGRIAVVSGNAALAAAQADSILKQAPNHLLGLSLAARAAEALGQNDRAKTHWNTFAKVRTAELARQLPEYVAHASDIEAATRIAKP